MPTRAIISSAFCTVHDRLYGLIAKNWDTQSLDLSPSLIGLGPKSQKILIFVPSLSGQQNSIRLWRSDILYNKAPHKGGFCVGKNRVVLRSASIRVIAPSSNLGIISEENRDLAVKKLDELGLKISYSKNSERVFCVRKKQKLPGNGSIRSRDSGGYF